MLKFDISLNFYYLQKYLNNKTQKLKFNKELL